MKPYQIVYSFLTMFCLTAGSAFAQTTGSGATTKPTATTSTNRQQELYDQYHGITKKPATNVPATTPTAAPAQPQRRTSDYSTQPATTASRPQQVSLDGSTSGVRIGVRGGITKTFFTEEVPLIKSTIGFVGGLTFNFGSGTFSFQPEINYARHNLKVANDFLNQEIKAAADVIEVPLFLKISSGTYAGHRFFVNVGPYGAYLASSSRDGKKESLSGRTDRFGFGGALGVGAALKAGPGHVTVEARGLYALGDTENGFSTDSRAINSQLTVGYSFPLGGR